MKVLYILQGIPGSGKSVMAEAIANLNDQQRVPRFTVDNRFAVICSTDDYRRLGDGSYEYNPDHNRAYHQGNQQKVIRALQEGRECVIVDNTNITRREARPYIQFAKAFDYTVQVVRVSCNVELAIARQAFRTDGSAVPEETIRRMYETMEDLTEEL